MQPESSVPRVYTGPQRVLRFMGVLYLAWCAIRYGSNIVLVLLALLFGFDPLGIVGATAGDSVLRITDLALLGVSAACNFFVAWFAYYAAVHPRYARRFRIVALVLAVINVLGIVSDCYFRQFPDLISSFYSLVISGMLFWLASQIREDFAAGEAVDKSDLPKTVYGKRIATERKLQRAIQEGTFAASSSSSRK